MSKVNESILDAMEENYNDLETAFGAIFGTTEAPAPKKRRGRPPKKQEAAEESYNEGAEVVEQAVKKTRKDKAAEKASSGSKTYTKIKYRWLFVEPVLGTSPSDPDIYQTYIGKKAGNKDLMDEELEQLKLTDEELAALSENEDGEVQLPMTVFKRMKDENGENIPIASDYQIKGFLKDMAGMRRRTPDSMTKAIKAYKKIIDGNITVQPRSIPIIMPEGSVIDIFSRPLRASSPSGERNAIAVSERIPAGSYLDVTIIVHNKSDVEWVKECVSFGIDRGFSQNRNSGYGRFYPEILSEELITPDELKCSMTEQYSSILDEARAKGLIS